MFVVLSYDVGVKRVVKVQKTVRKYLNPVQKSVFEGYISKRGLCLLKNELKRLIVPEDDSVVIYVFEPGDCPLKEVIGNTANTDKYIL